MSLEALKSSVSGLVIAREEGPYAAAREALIWNARKPPRYPHVIVGATSAADVQAAVRYARQHGLKVTARGGGHHWSGVALQDGVVIDLSGLDAVTIDPAARIADVGPGVSHRDLARALAGHGLAFPVGHCATVPLSGYLLGGGLGWNSGAWGIACFSVESVDVVTAEGELLRASEAQNADIFWAARGAGPAFFGVVTSYRLRLHRLPRAITTSTWTYRLEDIGTLERWISSSQPVLPRNVEFSLLMSSAPPTLAHRCAKVVTAMVTVFADSVDEARIVLGSVAASAPPGALDASLNVPTPFEALFEMNGAAFPHNRRYAADTYWSTANAGIFLETLAARVKDAPSPASIALGVLLPPPEPGAPGLPDAAFSMVAPVFGCSYAVWEDAEDDELNVSWLRETSERLAPITLGHYIGEAHLDDDAHIPRSFSPAAWARLERARATYDPEGLFSKTF
ncbi:MAG: FAD-binding oxidoreductase [Steroidobacteraceae bacterium]|nr:FAD-binding oxidoreductase [Steroidobacteraceae bacterium]